MLDLQARGLGAERGIPSLLLAAANLNSVPPFGRRLSFPVC